MALKYQIRHADESLLPRTFELFLDGYRQAQTANPLLPDLAPPQQKRLQQQIADTLNKAAVVATCGDEVLAYMGASAQFNNRGQRAAIISEFGHASVRQDRKRIYQHLYAALAEELLSQGVHIHMIGHFSDDLELTEILFQLGFGALVAERLRDLSDVANCADVAIVQEKCWRSIADLAVEHTRYYRDSPIFLVKDDAPAAVAKDLEEHQQDGDQLLVYREGDETKAYFIVGRCFGVDEGQLLYGTNTAQIKSAYVMPSARCQGIGRALLQKSIRWARGSGCDRIFVEHETANVFGGNFWQSHFAPYIYFSMRYVDSRL